MKNSLVSTLAAIALALPLGIGGLILTAPGTATDAEAQSFLQPQSQPDALDLLRQFQDARCTVYQLWDCDDSVVSHVAGEFRSLFDFFAFDYSVAFPSGSNGANQITFDTLVAELDAANGERRDLIERYLRTVFSDSDVDPGFPHPHRGTGYIDPVTRADWRRDNGARWDAERARREAARRQQEEEAQIRRDRTRFITHCVNFRRGDLDGRGRNFGEDDRLRCIYTVDHSGEYGYYNKETVTTYFDELDDPVAFQITAIEPFSSLSEIEQIEDHRQATSDNRERIVELQEEVTDHEDRLTAIEPAVARNTQIIEALGNSVGVLSEAISGLLEDTEKNKAGIALAFALDAPGLSYGKRYAITGALGQFRGESAVGFSGSFKAGENVLISVGGGFAGSGDSSVTGGKVSATFEW